MALLQRGYPHWANLDDWLRARPGRATTRNVACRYLNLLFYFAESRGYRDRNPVKRTAKANVNATPSGYFHAGGSCPRSCCRCIPCDGDAALLGHQVLCRDRVEEIESLDWKDIRLERRFIEVSAANARTSSCRLVAADAMVKEAGSRLATPRSRDTPSRFLPRRWQGVDHLACLWVVWLVN